MCERLFEVRPNAFAFSACTLIFFHLHFFWQQSKMIIPKSLLTSDFFSTTLHVFISYQKAKNLLLEFNVVFFSLQTEGISQAPENVTHISSMGPLSSSSENNATSGDSFSVTTPESFNRMRHVSMPQHR